MTIFRDFPSLPCLTSCSFALLAACGGPTEQSETAEDYAARVDGTAPVAGRQAKGVLGEQTAATVATPLPGAAPGPMEAGTQTDPSAKACGATVVAEYLGQGSTSEIQEAISKKAQARGGVRFIRPGEAHDADVKNNRLNVMYDASDVIRDFRCG